MQKNNFVNCNLAKIPFHNIHGDQITQDQIKIQIVQFKQYYKKQKLKKILIDFESASLFFCSFIAAMSSGTQVIILPNNKESYLLEYQNYFDEVISPKTLDRLDHKVSEIDNILLDLETPLKVFTSGSSGRPTLIHKKFKNLYLETVALEKMFNLNHEQYVFCSTVSHQHIYGLLFRILWPALHGHCSSETNLKYPEDLSEISSKRDKLFLVSGPAFLMWVEGAKLSNFCRVFSSGGKLPGNTAKRCQEVFGMPVMEIYGSTETGGIAYRTQESENQIWQSFPTVELSSDTGGRLVVKSPFILEESFQTNDKVSFCTDSQFILEGRTDRIIKIAEKKLSLEEMEHAIKEMTGISDAYCIGIERGQRFVVGALVVLEKSGHLYAPSDIERCKYIRKALAQRFDHVLLPKKIRFLDKLPYNKQSKIDQGVVKEILNGPA